MTKPRVLVLGRAVTDSEHFFKFSQLVEPVPYKFDSRESFIRDLKTIFSDISGIWVAQGGFYSTKKQGAKDNVPVSFDREFISHFPESLKVISICSIGYDRYDVEALHERGIVFCNTPDLASDQVADTALYHVLNSFRFYNFFDRTLRTTGTISKARILAASKLVDPDTGFPTEPEESHSFILADQVNHKVVRTPRGHVAGIVGLGGIGQQLAKRLVALGMEVHYTKRKPLTERELQKLGDIKLQYHETFESLLPVADVLAFCVPLNPQTRHMLNKETLSQCKDGVRVVNIGRGPTINQADLVEALKSGKVAHAGLDVFEDEPNVSPDVLKRYDISVTPHIGSSTLDNRILSSESCQDNILNVLIDGGEGLTPIRL